MTTLKAAPARFFCVAPYVHAHLSAFSWPVGAQAAPSYAQQSVGLIVHYRMACNFLVCPPEPQDAAWELCAKQQCH